MRKRYLTATFLLLAGIAAGQENYATSWSGHSYLNLNTSAAVGGTGAGIDTTFVKFPLLVRLGLADSAVFRQSKGDGSDLRFTKLNNTTRLHHSIDHWDSAGRTAAVWVLMDTIHPKSSGSRLRMHWGNASAMDSSRAAAVFDSANGYVAVWHMGGDTSTAARANAVAGGAPALPQGSVANLASGWKRKAGMIGLADTLRGATGTDSAARASGDHLSLGATGARDFSGGLTISMWMKPTEDPEYSGWMQYISLSNGQGNNNIWMGRRGDGMNLTAEYYVANSSTGHIDFEGMQMYDEWAYLAWTVESPDIGRLYHNGVLGTEQTAGMPLDSATERPQNHIGRSPWPDRNIIGMVDEVRISRVARPTAWIKLEYANQRNGQTFLTRTAESVPVLQDPVSIRAGHQSASSGALSFQAQGRGVSFRITGEKAASARLSVVDMHGRTVWQRTLATSAGMNQVTWNGLTQEGRAVVSGVYFVRMALLDAGNKPVQTLDGKLPIAR